ncbi:hypothetical protein C8J57DRAFT_1240473 [Mycena rebaudengoi]|nr:hypothetical protein C8J57DRAFT_1240473 [Mycena rebaudengoi]
MFRLLFGALGYQILWRGWSDFFIGEHVRKFKSMEFDPIKDVLASNLVAIQEALILGIRASVRDSVHGLIDYQYFAQVQEREKYWGGTARENEKGNSQQGREHFRWLLLRRSTAPDLADYASPRHAQRFRNYCGTVGLVFILLRELATWTTRPQECGRVWTKCEVPPRRMGQGCMFTAARWELKSLVQSTIQEEP